MIHGILTAAADTALKQSQLADQLFVVGQPHLASGKMGNTFKIDF
jgi:hypothetical protein